MISWFIVFSLAAATARHLSGVMPRESGHPVVTAHAGNWIARLRGR
jgi:hypothetical protein